MEKLKLNIQLFAISPSSLTSTAKAGGNFYAILSSTQNVDNLTTTVTLKAKGVSSGGYYLYGRGFYYKIGNGNWVTLEESYSQSSYVTKSSYSVEWWKTFTFTVPHNPDGTAPTLQIRLKHGFQYGMSDERWNEQASSQYNASHTDFNITLSDIVVPVEETNIRLGLNSIQKMYLGNNLISAMWLGLKKIFPSESSWRDRYQEIEYIESTGTQHIMIDYFLDNQCSVEYKALFKNKTTTPVYEAIFSNGTYSSSFFYNTIPNDKNKFSYLKKQTDRSPYYGFSVTYNKIYRINNDYKNNKLYVYDENNTNLYTYTLTYTSITAKTNKLSIFSENGTEKTMLMQLYSFVISKNGDDIINLVPVYRKSDNKPGMYDTVSDTFYVNIGTGEFTVGPDIN